MRYCWPRGAWLPIQSMQQPRGVSEIAVFVKDVLCWTKAVLGGSPARALIKFVDLSTCDEQ